MIKSSGCLITFIVCLCSIYFDHVNNIQKIIKERKEKRNASQNARQYCFTYSDSVTCRKVQHLIKYDMIIMILCCSNAH